jgi:hypothetical protein
MPAHNFVNLTGQTFGRLTVLHLDTIAPPARTMWVCMCDCGVPCSVYRGHLRNGHTTSCGCVNRERITTQGGGHKNIAYPSWLAMVSRCTNKKQANYVNYGAKGIAVCDEWHYDFQAFLTYIGPRPSRSYTIDRIDNTKGYEPGNVRWATGPQQNANRSCATMVNYEGKYQSLSLLAHAHGMDRKKVGIRVVHQGWSVHDALHTPTGAKRNIK